MFVGTPQQAQNNVQVIELVTIIKFQNDDTAIKVPRNEKLIQRNRNSELPFFEPASEIVPRQFRKAERSGRRNARLMQTKGSQPCYTHTVNLFGKCYVMCDKNIVRRC